MVEISGNDMKAVSYMTTPPLLFQIKNLFLKYADYLTLILIVLIISNITYWTYNTAYPPRGLKDIINGIFWGFLVSIGLLVSTTKIGKKFWYLTFLLMIPSFIAHIFFVTFYSGISGFIPILFEIALIISLPQRRHI
jgi:hypothetical protein